MNIQEAHEILDNYKSSSLIDINKALFRTGDLDVHQYATSLDRTLRHYGIGERLDRSGSFPSKGVRVLPLWNVVRHWKANQATYGRIEGEE
jgi:hypothetical protein